jgi:hypothetical protein
MKDHWELQGFNIVWYTGSSVVAGTLQSFREQNLPLQTAADLFLLPGPIDADLENVIGAVPATFLRQQIPRTFTLLFLGAHSFDMSSGQAFFHFTKEIEFQKACALLPATQKFLFLDRSKFRKEGEPAYDVSDLLASSRTVTIYTVMGEGSQRVIDEFETLASTLGLDDGPASFSSESRTLRLCLVVPGSNARVVERQGRLRAESPKSRPAKADRRA